MSEYQDKFDELIDQLIDSIDDHKKTREAYRRESERTENRSPCLIDDLADQQRLTRAKVKSNIIRLFSEVLDKHATPKIHR